MLESYSQHGQDLYIYDLLYKNKSAGGVFVDVGAYDGVVFSNTLFFEKHLGWKGVCIEPIPDIFRQLKENRTAICLDYAILMEMERVPFSK